jgi:hypothetical protein
MTIVEQIHNEIDTAQDRLYNEAVSYINNTESFKQKVGKAERLKKLGFTSTETVVEADKEVAINDEAKKKADLIVRYKTRYPFLKFLTLEELDRICDKYDLVYAPVQNYKKDVPEKNLRDIENAQQLDYSDMRNPTYTYKVQEYFSYVPSSARNFIKNLVTEKRLGEFEILALCPVKFGERYLWTSNGGPIITKTDYLDLFIAAPKDHFDLENLTQQKKGFFKTEIFKPEPIDN